MGPEFGEVVKVEHGVVEHGWKGWEGRNGGGLRES